MSDRELALELIIQYVNTVPSIKFDEAVNCAKIDLNNRIELLKELFMEISSEQFEFEEILKYKSKEIKTQITHLNNL